MKGAEQQTITVDNEECLVTVAQSSKVVWIAYGDFRGQPIRGSGSSASSARSEWMKKANHKANE